MNKSIKKVRRQPPSESDPKRVSTSKSRQYGYDAKHNNDEDIYEFIRKREGQPWKKVRAKVLELFGERARPIVNFVETPHYWGNFVSEDGILRY